MPISTPSFTQGKTYIDFLKDVISTGVPQRIPPTYKSYIGKTSLETLSTDVVFEELVENIRIVLRFVVVNPV
jgi:hypothetical protein